MSQRSSEVKVAVTGVTFDTPLILASGYMTETPGFFLKSIKRGCGCASMVTRSLKKNPRGEVTSPRYYVSHGADYMLNAEWGNEHPWTRWRDEWVDQVAETGKPLILSLSGRNTAECAELVSIFDTLPVSAFEINVSCSHSGHIHGNLNVNIGHVSELIKAIRPNTKKPIWIKLGYSSFLVDMALEAEKHGADAIVATNSIGPGLIIDTASTKPVLGIKGGCGGVTGKAIFPIALQCVWTLRQALSIPVVASGGVSNSDETLQMLMAGASAVQLYTEPALRGPKVFSEIMKGLKEYCSAHSINITDIIGQSLKWADSNHSFTAAPPIVVEADCTGCGLCAPSCAFGAIRFKRQGKGQKSIAVIQDNCNTCNACVGVCPESCIIHEHQNGRDLQ